MLTKRNELKHIKKLCKVDQLIQTLKESIMSIQLKQGTELPPKSDLACQLGVSKFSIREALRFLESQRFIEIIQGRRTKVAALPTLPASEIISIAIRGSKSSLFQLIEARQRLEVAIVRFAAI
jgi:GntR family transcriptional repressor for pyruvate dehydrogenase complex